jgi:hypothetical protein
LRLPLLAAGVGVAFALSRTWPTDQAVHVILGDSAPHVIELRIRYGDPVTGARPARDEWEREATFHYARGRAPRIVSHEPRLVSGDYDVEIEISMATDPSGVRTVTETRRVALGGGSTSIDVSRQALDGAGPGLAPGTPASGGPP